ncbi:TauD/TfdA dioxygenase family protein [Saccharopolyspora endophytica]|uniref:TauD/TfdA family dioxygenase n=1 Tax=Saccharopolyspora endophytica TaxID=543886 RepID=A0ABS5DQ32_9PSEU|nr:TauD/TfdA family dioxygenase [Saccharopolyspora endophytica]MBQ0928414.1 TauD/TfdA family dioxygenase [Saccharopolyspora endophytica]
MTSIDVRPASGALGAEVRGLDLESLTEDSFAQLHALLVENLVLFFPEAEQLSPEAHKAFGRFLGELEVHPFLPKLDGHDEIVVLDSDQGAKADVWHTDVTFQASPPIASILQIVQCPPRGGDTMWSNQHLAYENLSAPLRDFLEGLTAVHAFTHPNGTVFEAEHPVVRAHPVTGRRSLYVNRMFTLRIPQLRRAESDALLGHLFSSSERPENVCRFSWKPGAIAMWDNRATQHYAVNDYTERRVGRRVTILGDVPKGEEPRWPHLTDATTAADFRKDS